MPAQRCGDVYIGDAILSVNGTDLKDSTHKEAVHVLSRVHGNISMELLFVDTEESIEEDDNWEEDNQQRFFLFFLFVLSRFLKWPTYYRMPMKQL